MTKHCKIYFKHFNIGEQELVSCEVCGIMGRADGSGFDIHHIWGRGKGKDVIENLMVLCRKDHDLAHAVKISKKELQAIHDNHLKTFKT